MRKKWHLTQDATSLLNVSAYSLETSQSPTNASSAFALLSDPEKCMLKNEKGTDSTAKCEKNNPSTASGKGGKLSTLARTVLSIRR